MGAWRCFLRVRLTIFALLQYFDIYSIPWSSQMLGVRNKPQEVPRVAPPRVDVRFMDSGASTSSRGLEFSEVLHLRCHGFSSSTIAFFLLPVSACCASVGIWVGGDIMGWAFADWVRVEAK